MLLCVDCGNTQTVIGMYDGDAGEGELVDQWRIATNVERTSDEHALLLDQLLGLHVSGSTTSGASPSHPPPRPSPPR